MTTVSIITPTYNRPDLLGEAIASMLAQSFDDWEMLVVDDASPAPNLLSTPLPTHACATSSWRMSAAAPPATVAWNWLAAGTSVSWTTTISITRTN